MPKIRKKSTRRCCVIRSSSEEENSETDGPKKPKIDFGKYLKEKHTNNYTKPQLETLIESNLSENEDNSLATDKNKSKPKHNLIIFSVSSKENNCDNYKNISGKYHKDNEDSSFKDETSIISLRKRKIAKLRNSQYNPDINSFIEDENETSDNSNGIDDVLPNSIIEFSSDEDEIKNKNELSKIESWKDQNYSNQLIDLLDRTEDSDFRNFSQLITREVECKKRHKLRCKKHGYLEKFYLILKRYESNAMFWIHETQIIPTKLNNHCTINSIQILYGQLLLSIQLSTGQLIRIFMNAEVVSKMKLEIGSSVQIFLDGDRYDFGNDIIYLPINKISLN